jgi:hypothetical protein
LAIDDLGSQHLHGGSSYPIGGIAA